MVCLYQSRDELRARPSLLEARRLVASGARLHGAALLAVLLAQADRFVVVTFWDDATLGLYIIALTFAGAGLDVVTGAFNVVLLPRLAVARDLGAQRRIMGQTLRYTTLLLTAGTALAANSTAMLPAAPARLSTIHCWPSASPSRGARILASVSVPPPGEVGTRRRMGRVGYFPSAAYEGTANAMQAPRSGYSSGSGNTLIIVRSIRIVYPLHGRCLTSK